MSFRVGDGSESRSLQFCQDEGIHCGQRPGPVTHRRWRGILHGLVSPMLAACFQIHAGGLGDSRHRFARIGCAALHPLLQHGDLTLRQLRFRWHLDVWVGVTHRFDEATICHIARHHSRPAIAARLPARSRIQYQPTLDLGGVGMALVAALLQNGFHLATKESVAFCGGRSERQ